MWLSVLSIGAGAAIGANLRWLLGVWLNALFPAIPPGTLVANLLGAWLIGIGIAFFAQLPSLSPELRLFVITGFLGGFTTFSTAMLDAWVLWKSGRPMLAGICLIATPVAGVFAAFSGLLLWQSIA